MAATIFEQLQSGGTAAFLVTGTETIDIGTDGNLSDAVGDTQSVSITKLHWTTGGTVTEEVVDNAANTTTTTTTSSNINIVSDVNLNFTLDGNGVWSQFNGWTPVECNSDIVITFSGTGSLFIEIKKLAGFTGRTDYSSAAP